MDSKSSPNFYHLTMSISHHLENQKVDTNGAIKLYETYGERGRLHHGNNGTVSGKANQTGLKSSPLVYVFMRQRIGGLSISY
jgi:hypothetical protein